MCLIPPPPMNSISPKAWAGHAQSCSSSSSDSTPGSHPIQRQVRLAVPHGVGFTVGVETCPAMYWRFESLVTACPSRSWESGCRRGKGSDWGQRAAGSGAVATRFGRRPPVADAFCPGFGGRRTPRRRRSASANVQRNDRRRWCCGHRRCTCRWSCGAGSRVLHLLHAGEREADVLGLFFASCAMDAVAVAGLQFDQSTLFVDGDDAASRVHEAFR